MCASTKFKVHEGKFLQLSSFERFVAEFTEDKK